MKIDVPRVAGRGNGPLSLKRNFSWTLAGNLTYSACQWGMITVLAKLGDAGVVGQFALASAVINPFFSLSNLQLRGVQVSDAERRFKFDDYLNLRVVTSLLTLLILGLVLIGSSYTMEVIAVVALVAVGRLFDEINDIYFGAMQQREQMDLVAFGRMLNGVLSLVGLGVGMYLTSNLIWAVAASSAVSGALYLFYCIPALAQINRVPKGTYTVLRAMRTEWQSERMWSLFKLSLPLGVVMFLLALNRSIPRYYVESYLDEERLGIFAALAYVIVAGSTIVNALGQSASPRLAKYHAIEEKTRFYRLLIPLVAIGLVFGIVGAAATVLFGEKLLTLLYTPEYAEHTPVFIVLVLGSGLTFASSFLGYGLTAARQFGVQVPIYIAVVLTVAATGPVFIPSFGLNGAAWSVACGAGVQFLGSITALICMERKASQSD